MSFKFGRRRSLFMSFFAFFALFTFANYIIALKHIIAFEPNIGKDLNKLEANDRVVISTIKNSYLVPPSTLPYNLSTDEIYQQRSTSYHWDVIHQLLTKFFTDQHSGYFVEAGALDGEFLSNTLWLEREQGWTGLLIEPEPNNYDELLNKRRKSWISNSCISNSTHPMQIDMVATVKREHEPLDPMAIRGGAHFIGAHDNDNEYKEFENKKLILSKFRNLQGPEIAIFMTLPLDKINIRSVVIEHESFSVGIDYDFIKQMKDKGFIVAAVGGSPDYFFINENDERLVSIFNYLLKSSKLKKVFHR